MWCAEKSVNCKTYYWQEKILGIANAAQTLQLVDVLAARRGKR
ncbi:MAG: hypothetical protein RR087_04145 [Oscillospiraceae bacterium]